MKARLAELPIEIINHIHSFFGNAYPASALLSPQKIWESGNLLSHNLFGLPVEKYHLIKYYLSIYELLENSFYQSGHIFGIWGPFTPTGDDKFMEWLRADSSQRCSYRDILTLIVYEHNEDIAPADKEDYINSRCDARELYFKQAQRLLMKLLFTKNFLQREKFAMGNLVINFDEPATRNLAELLFERQKKPKATITRVLPLVEPYLDLEEKFPQNCLNTHENQLTEEEFIAHIEQESRLHSILRSLLTTLTLFPNNFYFLQLTLKSQAALSNMALGNYDLSLIHVAVRSNNYNLLCYLIDQGADVNKRYEDTCYFKSICSPLMLAFQLLELYEKDEYEDLIPDLVKIIYKLLDSHADINQRTKLDAQINPLNRRTNDPYPQITSPKQFCEQFLYLETHFHEVACLLDSIIYKTPDSQSVCPIF